MAYHVLDSTRINALAVHIEIITWIDYLSGMWFHPLQLWSLNRPTYRISAVSSKMDIEAPALLVESGLKQILLQEMLSLPSEACSGVTWGATWRTLTRYLGLIKWHGWEIQSRKLNLAAPVMPLAAFQRTILVIWIVTLLCGATGAVRCVSVCIHTWGSNECRTNWSHTACWTG